MLPNESVPSLLDVLLDPPGNVRWSSASPRLTSSAYKPSEYKQPPLSRQHKYGKQIISFILWHSSVLRLSELLPFKKEHF